MGQSLVGAAVAFGLFAGAPGMVAAGVVCDRFELRVTEDGERLLISVDTDLPSDTVVMASVGRSYWQSGKREAYSRDYLEERSTVGKWKSPRPVSVDDDEWERNLREHQKEMARATLGFEVAKISDEIEVSFVVPVNQPNPAFGAMNRNLTGRKVQTEGLRTVTASVRVRRPLGAETGRARSAYLDPLKLVSGDRVRVSRRTPLVPSDAPADPVEAIAAMRNMEPGTVFEVSMPFHDDRQHRWYSVRALDAAGAVIATGKVNSTALIGQDLERAE